MSKVILNNTVPLKKPYTFVKFTNPDLNRPNEDPVSDLDPSITSDLDPGEAFGNRTQTKHTDPYARARFFVI